MTNELQALVDGVRRRARRRRLIRASIWCLSGGTVLWSVAILVAKAVTRG